MMRALRKQAPHLLRKRVGDDVEVFRLAREQQVAHAAADETSFEPGAMQPVEHAECAVRDVAARDRMVGARNDARRRRCAQRGAHGHGEGL
jgi:hypothetical protein